MERCIDGRGVRRAMIAWWGKKGQPGLSEARAGEIQSRAKAIVKAAGGAAGATMGMCLILPALMAMNLAGIPPAWWHVLIIGPLGWPICWAFMSRASKRVCGMVLAEGFCPSCAAPLDGLAPDTGDGCTVCPGCGGAWHVVPVARGAAAL